MTFQSMKEIEYEELSELGKSVYDIINGYSTMIVLSDDKNNSIKMDTAKYAFDEQIESFQGNNYKVNIYPSSFHLIFSSSNPASMLENIVKDSNVKIIDAYAPKTAYSNFNKFHVVFNEVDHGVIIKIFTSFNLN